MKRLLWLTPILALHGCLGGETGLSVTGQVEGMAADAGSRVGGRVVEVLAEEGDQVEPGQTLLRLEPDEAESAVAAAEAQLGQAEAALAKLRAGARKETLARLEAAMRQARQQYEMALEGARNQEIQAARAQAEAAEAVVDEAGQEYERIAELYANDNVAKRDYDRARSALERARANLEAARQSLDLLVEGAREEQIAMAQAGYEQAKAAYEEAVNGARPEDIAAAEAARDAAAAQLRQARVALGEMTVVSPKAGVVESIDVQPGDIVKPGPLARVIDPDDLEATVYVSAGALGHIRLNQTVPITTDSHKGRGIL